MNRSLVLGLLCALFLAVSANADPCPNVVFTLKQTLSGGYTGAVETLTTVDYDHDGKLDLVGTIRDANNDASLYSWHGVGDGTFEAAVSLGQTKVTDLKVWDINNDAYVDLVGVAGDYHVWVRFGNPTGFNPAITTSIGIYPYDISVGNFQFGDNNIDVVVSSIGAFSLMRGNGDGTFTETQRITTDANDWTTDNTVADFDNDGRFDIALSQRMSEQLHVYFQIATGTFAAPVTLPTGPWAAAISAADYDEDGFIDLVSANWDDGNINVFRNQGNRTFSRQVLPGKKPGSQFGNLNSLIVIDINGDSHADITAAAVNGNWIATYLGDGDGGFSTATWSTVPGTSYTLTPANLDSDGALELVTGGYQEVYVLDYTCTPQVSLYNVNRVISTGQTAKLRAVVSGISSHIPPPLGTITFKEGATTLGAPIAIDANGSAALDYNGFSTGDHTITAEFSGNSVIGAATSASVLQRVVNTPSTIALTLAPSTHGEPFNITVAITVNGSPTNDSYRLTIDGVTESNYYYSGAPVQRTLSAGPHTISAEYPGSFFYPPATSPTYNITTAKHAVTLAKSGDISVRQGTAHTIQISVNVPTSPVPTGSVTLSRGATQIGGPVTLVNGAVTFTATLPRGSYTYTAAYSGDAYYLSGSTSFTLTVFPNSPVAIDARTFGTSILINAIVPAGTTATTLYRRVHGTASWSAVSGWSNDNAPFDSLPITIGMLYDYRLDATVSGQLQQSNIDSALVYTDTTLDTADVKLVHFTEMRDAINGLRETASLPPFAFDGTFGSGATILGSHLSALRTAATEARTALGMATSAFTDPSPVGASIKRVQITELRDSAD
jgi:hypothetical protein